MRHSPILEGRNSHFLCGIVLLFFKLAVEGGREKAGVFIQDLFVLL